MNHVRRSRSAGGYLRLSLYVLFLGRARGPSPLSAPPRKRDVCSFCVEQRGGCEASLRNPLVGCSGDRLAPVPGQPENPPEPPPVVHSPPDPQGILYPIPRPGSKCRPRGGYNPTNIILAPLPGGPTAISFSGYGIMPHNFTSSVISSSDTGPLYCLGGPNRSQRGGIPRARSPARGPIETTAPPSTASAVGHFCE